MSEASPETAALVFCRLAKTLYRRGQGLMPTTIHLFVVNPVGEGFASLATGDRIFTTSLEAERYLHEIVSICPQLDGRLGIFEAVVSILSIARIDDPAL